MREPPRRWPQSKTIFRKAPWLGHPPKPYWRYHCAGTARARQPLECSTRNTIWIGPIFCLRARIGTLGSDAAMKRVNPRGEGVFLAGRFSSGLKRLGPSPRGFEHVVAVALPKVPIRALKLGDRTSPAGVARGQFAGLRCPALWCRQYGLGRCPSQGAFLKVFFGCGAAAVAAGARAFHGGGAPKSPHTRPQARR